MKSNGGASTMYQRRQWQPQKQLVFACTTRSWHLLKQLFDRFFVSKLSPIFDTVFWSMTSMLPLFESVVVCTHMRSNRFNRRSETLKLWNLCHTKIWNWKCKQQHEECACASKLTRPTEVNDKREWININRVDQINFQFSLQNVAEFVYYNFVRVIW